MMRREDVIDRLQSHAASLQRLGVTHLYLFGSVARNEASAASDIDLFIDYDKGRFGLFELMDVRDIANRALGGLADVTTRDSLHKAIRSRIEASAVQVLRVLRVLR